MTLATKEIHGERDQTRPASIHGLEVRLQGPGASRRTRGHSTVVLGAASEALDRRIHPPAVKAVGALQGRPYPLDEVSSIAAREQQNEARLHAPVRVCYHVPRLHNARLHSHLRQQDGAALRRHRVAVPTRNAQFHNEQLSRAAEAPLHPWTAAFSTIPAFASIVHPGRLLLEKL